MWIDIKFLFFAYLSNLYTQYGSQTPDPEIKSHTFLQVSQPYIPDINISYCLNYDVITFSLGMVVL